MELAHLDWWASFLSHICPTLTHKGLYTRLTKGDDYNQLPITIWEKLHSLNGRLNESEVALAEAKVQPIRDAMINEMRQVLIDYLVMARLDLLAKELRFDVHHWGPATQHCSPVSPARVRAPKRATLSDRPRDGLARYGIYDVELDGLMDSICLILRSSSLSIISGY